MLHVRGSFKAPWLSIIERPESWPIGAGLQRSSFTIGRSEPTTDEETWVPVQLTSGGIYTGSCGVTYVQTQVGYLEVVYKPEQYGLVGPLVCQDDFTLSWNSNHFWELYWQALEKRSVKSIVNRLANIYGTYATKVYATASGSYVDTAGNITTQPPGVAMDVGGITGDLITCGLSQDLLDNQSLILSQLGADHPDSNGWITQGPAGPQWPLLIGEWASNELLLNNAELRNDFNMSFQGWGNANPVIQRLGASRVIKNFRHVIDLFPPRWGITDGTNALYRVPTWVMSTASRNASKGAVAIVNPDWNNPAVACIEGAFVLNNHVYTEEPLMPVNSMPGMKLNPQNYMGEWNFITGNDALIGFPDCPAGAQDPTKKLGRHVAEYRHGTKPIFPDYGRLILFRRCPHVVECASCS